jgi:hypothetical protein
MHQSSVPLGNLPFPTNQHQQQQQRQHQQIPYRQRMMSSDNIRQSEHTSQPLNLTKPKSVSAISLSHHQRTTYHHHHSSGSMVSALPLSGVIYS